MPIYEYTCGACGKHEEKLEPMAAAAEHACPFCGAAAGMRRQLSVTSLAFSGAAPAAGPARPSCCSGGGCPYA